MILKILISHNKHHLTIFQNNLWFPWFVGAHAKCENKSEPGLKNPFHNLNFEIEFVKTAQIQNCLLFIHDQLSAEPIKDVISTPL